MLERCWKLLEVVGSWFGVPTVSNRFRALLDVKVLIISFVGLLEVETPKTPIFLKK